MDDSNSLEVNPKQIRNQETKKLVAEKHKRQVPARGRAFDRKSGTGFGQKDKRSGKGAYNWGGSIDKEMIEELMEELHSESH